MKQLTQCSSRLHGFPIYLIRQKIRPTYREVEFRENDNINQNKVQKQYTFEI